MESIAYELEYKQGSGLGSGLGIRTGRGHARFNIKNMVKEKGAPTPGTPLSWSMVLQTIFLSRKMWG